MEVIREMRALITGINGQLGHDLMIELSARGWEAVGSGSGETYRGTDILSAMPYLQIDISDPVAVEKAICCLKPDAVFHCSAWTAVDAAEDGENKPKVFALNVNGPENIAKACRKTGAKMIFPSTDYVFSGQGTAPWQADSKVFGPLNYYGETKLLGERAVESNTDQFYIVRTSWVFGTNGKNFINTMINVGKTHDSVRVVNDQIGTPTYTKDLSRLLADMAETEKYGFYHATNEGGFISWYDFCREFYAQYGLNTHIIPVSTEEYGFSKAARPFNSRLDKSKIIENGFTPLPDWHDAVKRYLSEAQL